MSPQVNFDAAAVPESEGEFTLLPDGWYKCAATASELKNNSKGTGSFLVFEFTVLDGPAKGRKLWSRFTWEHTSSAQAVEIGHRQFADLCEACHKASVVQTEELHGVPFDASVRTEEGTGAYKDKNVIVSFRTLSSATTNAFSPAEAATETAEQGWG